MALDKEVLKLIKDLTGRLNKYSNDVIDGEIIACKKHIWSCKRFLKDLKSDKYFFDEIELLRFYMWSRQFKHRAGVLKNKKIELTDFQLFIVGNLFCFKNKNTKLRRFRKAYIQLARKNAKSQLLAVIASYENFLSEEQAEVYLAGWDKEQSSIVYREILSQIKGCDRLKGKFKDSYGKLTSIKDGSFIKPLSREARNTGDGTNPSVGIVDEYHAHKTSEIYDVILSGMVAREQPLMCIITTAGFDLTRPCFKEYEYISKILNPDIDIDNEEYFAIVCELDEEDSIQDEKVWGKANPIVSTYEAGINYLRGELKAALDAPEKMRNFLTKNMNKWIDMRDGGYMNMSKWKEAGRDFTLNDFRGCTSIDGLDLSAKLDLTSYGKIFFKDNDYYIFSHSFIPEETFQRRLKENKLPWGLWREKGYITVTQGAVVDYNYIKSYIKNIEETYNIATLDIGYDSWNATQFAVDMDNEGYSMVEIRQGIKSLGEACKTFREEAYAGHLFHNNNPVLTWACSNAITKSDPNSNFMLDKSQSSEKIDPLAALINAMVIAIKEKEASLNDLANNFLENMGW